ncbi:MAG TPA: FKBP-type peptidyl-prolyl cis-trans isomerase [Candidatus Aquilonibacter sp.]|nr:FKBP-type peptidyl-prolyl cis-trans isomerase [Candidatus Aquilonibacter sp.]
MRIPAILLTLVATPLFAQTSHPAVHHTATAVAGGCVRVPELSPKIPALPPGSPCPKALYTITHIPAIRLDYGSPLLSPQLRQLLDQRPETFTLAYVDTKIGTGPLAEPHKWYTVHYTGYLADGTKFDSSVDRGEPISFPYGAHRVIEGWDTGFEGMHIGGRRRLFVPYQLGYGENGNAHIPPKAELIFDVELIAQSDTQPAPPKPPATHEPNGAEMPHRPSPAGTAAPPPVSSSTPSSSTQPAKPSTSSEPK